MRDVELCRRLQQATRPSGRGSAVTPTALGPVGHDNLHQQCDADTTSSYSRLEINICCVPREDKKTQTSDGAKAEKP